MVTLAKTLPENRPHMYKTLYGTRNAHVSLVIKTAFITAAASKTKAFGQVGIHSSASLLMSLNSVTNGPRIRSLVLDYSGLPAV